MTSPEDIPNWEKPQWTSDAGDSILRLRCTGTGFPLVEVEMSSAPLRIDVDGITVVVHATDGDWLARCVDGPARGIPAEFRIPDWVQRDELQSFLATLFARPATTRGELLR